MTKSAPFKLKYAFAPGEFVEDHMEYHGYSYEKFADLCGCSVGSVKKVVVDKKPLTMELAKKFEKELDIPAHVLMRIEKKYRLFNQSAGKEKVREKKASSVVKQPFTVAQQYG